MREMNWLILLISALATYRLSLMLSSEEGPLAIFARMRRKVPPKTNPGRGIRCFMCWSIWIAAAVTLYLLWLGTITKKILPLYWLAVSGATVLIHEICRPRVNVARKTPSAILHQQMLAAGQWPSVRWEWP